MILFEEINLCSHHHSHLAINRKTEGPPLATLYLPARHVDTTPSRGCADFTFALRGGAG